MKPTENPSQRFLDPQVIAKIKPFQLRTKYLIDGLQAGQNRRPTRGFSNEFSQHREYVEGDDHRRIDWKVFGRTDKFYLKQFEDESNLLSHLMFDVSPSMHYRGPKSPLSKLEFGQCLVACLGWLALSQRDAAGLTLFENSVFHTFSPATSPAALPDLLSALEVSLESELTESKQSFGLMPAVHALANRGIAFVFSDFFAPQEDIVNCLKLLRHQGNDVVAVQIVDPYEQQFPFDKITLFRGMESPFNFVVNPRRIRKTYLKQFQAFHEQLQRECAKIQIEFHQISTDTNIASAIASVLSNRVDSTFSH